MNSFITYIGSKKFLLNKVKLPTKINNYYEPFIGGGSMFLHVNNTHVIKQNYINDLDKDLIMVYRIIKKYNSKLLIELSKLNNLRGKTHFIKLIEIFNTNKMDKILLSAIYIFMTRRSFNADFKYNKKNNQIKPTYSTYNNKKKSIYDKKNIQDISKLLKKTTIKNQDYKTFLTKNKPGKDDFVFLDPPYLVKGVDSYYKEIFDLNEFEKFKKICDTLDKNKVNFMVTLNRHTKLIKLFKGYKFKYINKKSTTSNNKMTEKEMVITNY